MPQAQVRRKKANRRPDCCRCSQPRYSTSAYCKRCLQLYSWGRRLGLTWEEAEYIYDTWTGYCECCGDLCDAPVLDHDHESGEVRGLICYSCNNGLANFKDDVEKLSSAIDYLMN